MLVLELVPPLCGWDPTSGLIAFTLDDDGRRVRVFRREGGVTSTDFVPFTPFLLVADAALVRDASGLVGLTPLEGPGPLRTIARFDSWAAALAARDRCREVSGQLPTAPAAPYRFFPDPIHQYLLLTGRGSFGGLTFGELRRLALDIEVTTSDGFEFPSATRPGDRVVAVALADSTGFRHVVRGDRLEEAALLAECTRLIRERDPDVIEGHNIFRFDLEYLEARARLHGVRLGWGRDGSALRSRPSRVSIAERTIGYRRYEIAGRHVIDTWILAQLHDVGAREFPSFGLKDIARHLDVAAEGRTYVDAADIAREFRDAPDRLMAYAADDAVETLRVSELLSPPYFAQAQIVPFDYQSTALRGAAAKIDALLVREYLRRGRTIPLPRPVASVGGGHVAVLQQGVARPVLHVDVTSLYPSLMLARGIGPGVDELGTFLTLLGHLREFRVRAKQLAREAAETTARAHFMALQQSFKILINAFYGYLGFSGGHWNDFEAANRVTADGRGVIGTIIEHLGELGATVLEADTDGVYFVPPPGHERDDDGALLTTVATPLPEGIQLELGGRYAAMLSYKAKTYALLDERGRIVLRGSAFRSRGLEPFQRQIIAEIVQLLLTGRGADVKAVVGRWQDDLGHRRVPIRALARSETLQETMDSYRERVARGERNAQAAYEVALASGRTWQPGDQISFYVAGRGVDVTVNERAKLLGAWDPARPDENVEYYRAKVNEVWERFRVFAECEGLRPYVEPAPEASPQLSLF